MLPATDLTSIPANWPSFDGPIFDSTPMLSEDFDLLLSNSKIPFDMISGTCNRFYPSFPSASCDTITSICLPSNPSLTGIFWSNSMRFFTLYHFVTACQI